MADQSAVQQKYNTLHTESKLSTLHSYEYFCPFRICVAVSIIESIYSSISAAYPGLGSRAAF